MRNLKKLLCIVLSLIMTVTCLAIGVSASGEDHIGEKGTLDVISYDLNSIRLTDVLDAALGLIDVATIGTVLNGLRYDVVATQEDFDVRWEDYPIGVDVPEYHEMFAATMVNYKNITEEVDEDSIGGVIDSILGNEPEVIERHQTLAGGDGLGIYSTYAIYNTYRQKWTVADNILADGTPLLYDTGFVVTTIEITDGYFVDIYNVSTDEHNDSVATRKAQFAQLAQFIKKYSKYDEEFGVYEHAVIVMGNLNAPLCQEETVYANDGIIANLIDGANLDDAWAVTTIDSISEGADNADAYYEYALNTELTTEQAYGHYDSVEKILYADGNGIDLSCSNFNYAEICGELEVLKLTSGALSDHKAATAQINFEIVEKAYEYGNENGDMNLDTDESWLVRFLNSIANFFKAIGYFFQNLFK